MVKKLLLYLKTNMSYIRNKKITAPRAQKDLNMEGYASVPLQNGGKSVFPIAPSGGRGRASRAPEAAASRQQGYATCSKQA